MTRTLRGAWSRRGTLLPLFLLTAVVVAGLVTVIGLADQGGTSRAAAVPLLLLGLVAVPATGRQLAAVRRNEIALARLRGVTGGQLHAVLAVEPLMVLLAGALAGLAAGAALAWLAGRAWVGTGSASVGLGALPAVAGVVGIGLVAVLAGMAGALREPLSRQVSVAERPRAASTAALFGSVLLIVAAVVAAYRAGVADAEDPGWVVLAGPALVGLAVGQLVVWALQLSARASVAWSGRASLPRFLAARRLARTAGSATPVRLVVAAAVLGAVSLTGAQQVGDWAADTARIRAGAPLQVPLDDDVQGALALAEGLDPDGRYLMAAAVVPGSGTVTERRAYLDTARYDAVVGDFLAGTPAAGIAGQLDRLTDAEGAALARGDTVRVSVRGVSARREGRLRPRVTVDYHNDAGEQSSVALRLSLGPSGGEVSASARLPDCAAGCTLAGLRLDRSPGDAVLPWILTGLEFAGTDALSMSWRATTPGELGVSGGPVTVDDGLLMTPTERAQQAVPQSGGPRTPVLATHSARWDGAPMVDSPGGDERPAEVLARLPALPLVEADGLLADLPLTAAGAPPTVPAAEVMVLAAADTPRDVLARLASADGTGDPTTLADWEAVTDRATGAGQARVYALVAGFCLAVALLVAGAAVARQRAAHREEAAALRAVGVPLRQVRRSGWFETAVLAAVASVGAVVGGLLAVRLLLGELSLVTVPPYAVPLDVGVAPVPLGLAAAAAALAVLGVTGRAGAVPADQSRPAILREEALP